MAWDPVATKAAASAGTGLPLMSGGHGDHQIAACGHGNEELAAQRMAFQPGYPERQGGGVDPVDGDDRGGFRQQAVQPGAAVEAVGAAFVDPADLAQARLDDVAEGGEGFRRPVVGE